MQHLWIAMKNLRRKSNKILLLMVTLCTFFSIFMLDFAYSFEQEFSEIGRRAFTGDLVVSHQDNLNSLLSLGQPQPPLIEDCTILEQAISQDSRILAVGSEILVRARSYNLQGIKHSDIKILGIDTSKPELYDKVKIKTGHWPHANQDGFVWQFISSSDNEDFDTTEEVTFLGIAYDDSVYGIAARQVGRYRTMYFYLNEVVFLDRKAACELIHLPNKSATHIRILLKNPQDYMDVKTSLQTLFREKNWPLKIQDRYELGGFYLGVIQVSNMFCYFLIAIGFVVASLVMFNITFIALQKRRKEIGTLVCLGMSPLQVAGSFLLEMGIILILGWFLAAALGKCLNMILMQVGFPGMVLFDQRILYFQFCIFSLWMSWTILCLSTIPIVLYCWKIARLKPIETMLIVL